MTVVLNIVSIVALVYFVGAIVLAVILSWRSMAWVINLRLRTRYILLASLVVSCIVGVWGAATRAERNEPTFEANALYWPSMPLRVYAEPGDGHLEATLSAIHVWNRSVRRCEIFRGEGTRNAAQVRVRGFDGMPCGKPFRDLKGSEAKEKKEGTWDCHDGTMEILLNNPADFDTTFRTVLHGLGHTLRLDHDQGGVMDERIRLLTVVEPNPKDLEAVRERYCEESP